MFKLDKRNLIITAVTCLAIVIAASIVPVLRGPSLNTLNPVLSLLTLLKREFSGYVFYHRNMVDNERLKRQADFLRSKLNLSAEIVQENARLKELLAFKQKAPYKSIAARVISRSPDSWSSVVIIDKGTHQGVKQGMAAMTYLGIAGRVVEASLFTSKVMLVNDPNLGVSAIVQRSRQEGLAAGTLGTNLIMRYLPEGADIQAGDIIVTSGLNEIYPKGILIGTVVYTGKEFSGLSTYALIRPAVNLSNIEEVLVVFP